MEVYLPKAWHDWLTNVKAANLREVAVEAFGLVAKKTRLPSGCRRQTRVDQRRLIDGKLTFSVA